MKTADILREARTLIDTPEKWCQSVCGYDADGHIVGAREFNDGTASHVVSRCAGSAIVSVDRGTRGKGALVVLASVIDGPRSSFYDALLSVVDWNNADERSHAEVLAAFDKAATAAESAA